MKSVKKFVYYCDHCNKRGLSASAMKKHEKVCTLNINRECRLCENSPNLTELVLDFKKRFEIQDVVIKDEFGEFHMLKAKWIGEPVTVKEVLKSVDECPICAFAIIRQCEFNKHYFSDFGEFKYKKLVSKYFAEKCAEDFISRSY